MSVDYDIKASGFHTFGRSKYDSPTDEDIVNAIINDRVDHLEFVSFKHKSKEDTINCIDDKKYLRYRTSKLDLGFLMILIMCIITVSIFIGIDKYLEQKHIDSGISYTRFMKPDSYLVETIKLKDGTTWDVLCIDGVKIIYDTDKRLVSETNLVCY